MLTQLTILLSIAVMWSNAQLAADVAAEPVIIKPPPPPPPCRLEDREAVDTDDIVRRLNDGELGPQAEAASSAIISPVLRCEDGPKRIIHTVPNEFHWPPIYRGSCDKLFCKDPPCIARKTVWVTRCVYVFKLIHGKWVFVGLQQRSFLDHLKCGCKECNDIPTRRECVATKPCPNSANPSSFCYWTHRCECCTPFKCRPGTGQIFDRDTCKCVCPEGSKMDAAGNCIGDCEDISLQYCPTIRCADNRHFKCKVENYKCVCPSCDDVTSTNQCTRTRCLEQRNKPRCKVDPCTKKCRCPNCEDQPDKIWCDKTYCGPNYHLQCRWNPYYQSCSCPH